MALYLHNTASGERERVYAADGEALRFYCCGPTVYGPAHIGNFRTFLVQDLFRRVVEVGGLPVHHVRNLTDVDDKTIREAAAAGEDLPTFTARWRDRFHEDAAALNLLPPREEPSAVEHIPEQIGLIERLLASGHAYATADGSVYYRIASFPRYGQLSGIDREALRENASGRLEDADEYDKESVSDFVLWKAWKPEDGEVGWESPWGRGRPGWHTECSAMSVHYLGASFDVHGGGVDLCFPHHENEIAQSEGVSGERPFVRHWFHCEHLQVEGRKMSKSLGNFLTLADLRAEGFHPMEIRWALLSGHYRKTLNFTRENARAARKALQRLADLEHSLGRGVGTTGEAPLSPSWPEVVARGTEAFAGGGDQRAAWAALEDDLNAPEALGHFLREVGRAEREGRGWEPGEAAAWFSFAGSFLGVFGIDLRAWREDRAQARPAEAPAEVAALAAERWEAKGRRDFASADALRDRIREAGWQVLDRPDGYDLEPIGD